MHRILFVPDIRLAGYQTNPKQDTGYLIRAGYQKSGRIIDLTTVFLVKYQYQIHKNSCNYYRLLQKLQ
jgi:hypothetical protein